MCTTSACKDSIFLGTFLSSRPLTSLRLSLVHEWQSLSPCLKRFPKTCELANCRRPLNLSPSLRGSMLDFKASSINSSTLSSVFATKQRPSPEWRRSSWTPNTLQRVLKSNNLCWDILHPRREKSELTQKSTCLDSLLLDTQRKSSKYTDHMMWRRGTDLPECERYSEECRDGSHRPKWENPLLEDFGWWDLGIEHSKVRVQVEGQRAGPVCKHQRGPSTLLPNHHWGSMTHFASTKKSWQQCDQSYEWGHSLCLGDCKVHQGCLVVVDWSDLVLLLHWKALREGRPCWQTLAVHRTFNEAFSTSLVVAANRVVSVSKSPRTLHSAQKSFSS